MKILLASDTWSPMVNGVVRSVELLYALPNSHWLDELEAWGPEVIHTQSEFSTFMLAQRVARRCHCPVVHTYHTVYEDYTQYLFFSERLGRMTAEKATRILSGYCSLMLAPTEKVRGSTDKGAEADRPRPLCGHGQAR